LLVENIVAERRDANELGWESLLPIRLRSGLRQSGIARTCEAPSCTFSPLPTRRRDFSPERTLVTRTPRTDLALRQASSATRECECGNCKGSPHRCRAAGPSIHRMPLGAPDLDQEA